MQLYINLIGFVGTSSFQHCLQLKRPTLFDKSASFSRCPCQSHFTISRLANVPKTRGCNGTATSAAVCHVRSCGIGERRRDKSFGVFGKSWHFDGQLCVNVKLPKNSTKKRRFETTLFTLPTFWKVSGTSGWLFTTGCPKSQGSWQVSWTKTWGGRKNLKDTSKLLYKCTWKV